MKNTNAPTKGWKGTLKGAKRLPFTLIEVLLVIALLAMITASVSVNVRDLIGQQKFLNEVNAVTALLNRAQQLMLIYGQNVQVKFTSSKEGIKGQIVPDCLLDPKWEKWTTKNALFLTQIHSLNFHDEAFPNSSGEEKLIRFYPNGGGVSRGIMSLSTEKETGVQGGHDAYIALPGYPVTFRSEAVIPTLPAENPDPQIASLTKNEVLERLVDHENP